MNSVEISALTLLPRRELTLLLIMSTYVPDGLAPLRLGGLIWEPPHSLHRLRRRPCSHIDDPPHSLHRLRRRPCSHIAPPPHALHLSFRVPCSQYRCHCFAPTCRRLNPPPSSDTSSYSLLFTDSVPCLRLVEGMLCSVAPCARACLDVPGRALCRLDVHA